MSMKAGLLIYLLSAIFRFASAAAVETHSLSVIFDNGEVRVLGDAKMFSYQLQPFDAAVVDAIDKVVVDYDTRLLYVRPKTDFRGRRMDVYRFGSRKRLMALPGVSRIVIPQGDKAAVILAFRFQPADANNQREEDIFFDDFIKESDHINEFILQSRRRVSPNIVESSKDYRNAKYIDDLPYWAYRGCYSEEFDGFLNSGMDVTDMLTFQKKSESVIHVVGLDIFDGDVSSCRSNGNMWIKASYQNEFVYINAVERRMHRVRGRGYPAECFAVWSRSLLGCLAWNHEKKNIEYTEHSWRSEVTPTLEYHLEKAPLSMEAGDSFTVVGRDTGLDCLYFTELEFMRLDMTRNGQQLFELCFAEKPIIREVPLGRVGRGQKVVGVYVH